MGPGPGDGLKERKVKKLHFLPSSRFKTKLKGYINLPAPLKIWLHI